MATTNKMDFLYLKDFYIDSMTEEREVILHDYKENLPGHSAFCGSSKIWTTRTAGSAINDALFLQFEHADEKAVIKWAQSNEPGIVYTSKHLVWHQCGAHVYIDSCLFFSCPVNGLKLTFSGKSILKIKERYFKS